MTEGNLRPEIAEVVYRELGDMVNRDYLIDALVPVVAAAVAEARETIAREIEAHRDGERVEHLRIPPGSIHEAWTSAAAIALGAS